jgi:hypothetical protein
MFNILEISIASLAAACLVLLVGIVVFYANNRKEQQEIAKLNIRWPAWENRI